MKLNEMTLTDLYEERNKTNIQLLGATGLHKKDLYRHLNKINEIIGRRRKNVLR